MNCYCLSKKIPMEKENKHERKKEKNTDRTQTTLNAAHVCTMLKYYLNN